MADLFGGDIPIRMPSKKGDTIMSRWTRLSHYRQAEKGSKERCKHCAYLCSRRFSRTYFKCRKMGKCGASPATDIRVNHVCDYFTPEIENEP